ncbi:unnamed protein product [Pedinophyceae sp. YPF-701]|nr:unnamed protein product [Pedinophyceae sp. YPF-701]
MGLFLSRDRRRARPGESSAFPSWADADAPGWAGSSRMEVNWPVISLLAVALLLVVGFVASPVPEVSPGMPGLTGAPRLHELRVAPSEPLINRRLAAEVAALGGADSRGPGVVLATKHASSVQVIADTRRLAKRVAPFPVQHAGVFRPDPKQLGSCGGFRVSGAQIQRAAAEANKSLRLSRGQLPPGGALHVSLMPGRRCDSAAEEEAAHEAILARMRTPDGRRLSGTAWTAQVVQVWAREGGEEEGAWSLVETVPLPGRAEM